MECDGACAVSIDRWQGAYKGGYLDMTVAVATLFFRMICDRQPKTIRG